MDVDIDVDVDVDVLQRMNFFCSSQPLVLVDQSLLVSLIVTWVFYSSLVELFDRRIRALLEFSGTRHWRATANSVSSGVRRAMPIEKSTESTLFES